MRVHAAEHNFVRIFVPHEKLNVDLSGHGNPLPGTPVTLWGKWTEGRNQCWRFDCGIYLWVVSYNFSDAIDSMRTCLVRIECF
jgi:hypothetical protein